jgi:hypothetical protein
MIQMAVSEPQYASRIETRTLHIYLSAIPNWQCYCLPNHSSSTAGVPYTFATLSEQIDELY